MAADAASDRVLIGLLGDIQYANREDDPSRGRFYRSSLQVVQRAVAAFNDRGVNAVVTLGDMIDGYCADGGNFATSATWPRSSEACLEQVLSTLKKLKMPRHDVIGNHELYNFKHDRLNGTGLNLGEDCRTYYVRQYGNWDLIFLNTFEHFINDSHHGTAVFEESLALLQRYRPNIDDTILNTDWQVNLDGTRLNASQLHLVPCNGATSDVQRAWLRRTLSATRAAGRGAVVFSHAPVFSRGRLADALAWDSLEILAILHDFRETVHAVIAGHAHQGGYEVDDAGLHHVVVNAALEARPGMDCWAYLELAGGAARLRCTGRAVMELTDCDIDLRKASD